MREPLGAAKQQNSPLAAQCPLTFLAQKHCRVKQSMLCSEVRKSSPMRLKQSSEMPKREECPKNLANKLDDHVNSNIKFRFKLNCFDKDGVSTNICEKVKISPSNICVTQNHQFKPNRTNLTILHNNIQHLSSRIKTLSVELKDVDPDVVVLTEHKMSDIETECLNLQKFTVKSFYSRNVA